MGIFKGIFGRKIDCYQCETMVKEKRTLFRRGLRFCSANCVGLFLQQNPPKMALGGTTPEYTRDAIMEINGALEELNVVLRATGGSSASNYGGVASGVSSGASAVMEFDEAANAVGRFYDQVRTALPYIYSLGRTQDAEILETIDLDAILMMSRAFASQGGLQQSNMRRLAEESYEKVNAILHRIASGN